MQQAVLKLSIIILFSLISFGLSAGPWYTGPLLAPSGHTIPKGHTNLEVYGFLTDNTGFYDRHGRLSRNTPHSNSITGVPIFTHGMTDKLDIQFIAPYIYNNFVGTRYHRLTDTSVTLGYQVIEQGDSLWTPNLRFTVQEMIPTGKYELLSPLNNGTDVSGLGSYQTSANLNFQHLRQITEISYLRTRLCLAYFYASKVTLHGANAYGGSTNTIGNIKPGSLTSADLAAEYNITQNWVLVMEGFTIHRQASNFKGFPGTTSTGILAPIGYSQIDETSIAPALEYNFNESVGVIAGVWFSVKGREASRFNSTVIALNAYW